MPISNSSGNNRGGQVGVQARGHQDIFSLVSGGNGNIPRQYPDFCDYAGREVE